MFSFNPSRAEANVASTDVHYVLGLGENLVQFSLLATLTFLVGITIGVERVVLPPLAHSSFGITSVLYTVSFISAFGIVKSLMNLFAGRWSDRIGRKPLLVIGWVIGLGYPLLIIFATSWIEVVLANLVLGVNQALTWTMTVTGKIDLVGPKGRGFAVGINEASGYLGVSIGGLLAGALASEYGLRPAPYLLALAVIVIGGLISITLVKETLPWAKSEAKVVDASDNGNDDKNKESNAIESHPRLAQIISIVTWRDRAAAAASFGGFINKFADSLMIGFLPLYVTRRGGSVETVGYVAALYAGVWGLLQIPSGALADRVGRRGPVIAGQILVAVGIGLIVRSSNPSMWYLGGAVMGLGTALVYPNLISVIGDVAHPKWRGNSLGVYRLWRDAGYAVGPLIIAFVALLAGLNYAFYFTAVLSAISAITTTIFMYESSPQRRRILPTWERCPQWFQ